MVDAPIAVPDADHAAVALEPYAVHVWWVDLHDLVASGARDRQLWLSHDERRRAERFVRRGHRETFVAHRVALRAVLGVHVDARPADIRFGYGPYGRPMLCGPTAAQVSFSTSRTDGRAVIAVARGMAVGVDAERLRDDLPHAELAEQVLGGEACASIASAARPALPFFTAWVRMEATVKLSGLGMAATAALVRVAGTTVAAASDAPATLLDLDLEEGYAACVATSGRVARLVRHVGRRPWLDA